jgi:hypothetical protein
VKKPLLQLIQGGKKERLKFASFGRERDLEMLERYIPDPVVKARAIRQTTAANDLNDGIGTVDAFIDATREAVFPATQAARDAPLVLLTRIARYYPECLKIWDELAHSSSWVDRFTVACRLYSLIPEAKSDRLFHVLRSDKSRRVRALARDRYKNRPGDDGYIIFDMFDPDRFDERVRSGEVMI